jgi:23S rRNA (cytidine1920-2'-O)/16S rRNA (cytidine1409-2'-O)-methyltransferase
MRRRLDDLLVARGLAASKTQARALVMAGRVFCGTQRLDKPGRELAQECELSVSSPPRFVSRGGEKLAAALEHFRIDLGGAHVLDVGASTGGFTDCALQAGAGGGRGGGGGPRCWGAPGAAPSSTRGSGRIRASPTLRG